MSNKQYASRVDVQPDPKEWLSIDEAARTYRLARSTVRNYLYNSPKWSKPQTIMFQGNTYLPRSWCNRALVSRRNIVRF